MAARGRKPLTDEEKQAQSDYRKSEAGLKDSLLKLKQKEAETLLKIAMIENPGIEEAVSAVGNFATEVSKIDSAIESGGEVGLEKQRERIGKQVERYENKIVELREEAGNLTESVIVGEMKEKRGKALVNLKKAMIAAAPQFEAAGVEINDVINKVSELEAELAEIVIVEEETVGAEA